LDMRPESYRKALPRVLPMPKWGGKSFRCAIEQDVVFTVDGCRCIDGRQTRFYLV